MLFINNKYTTWYFNIINNSKTRILPNETYIEKHHIIAKCLGGDNSVSNIVRLTAREHFICHILLTKMTEGKNKAKMVYAIKMMCFVENKDQKRYINSHLFESIKKIPAIGENNGMYGKNHTKKSIEKMKKSSTGKKQSRETITKNIKSRNKTIHNRYKRIIPEILKIQSNGIITYKGIARKLNDYGFKTDRGYNFNDGIVKRMLNFIENNNIH